MKDKLLLEEYLFEDSEEETALETPAEETTPETQDDGEEIDLSGLNFDDGLDDGEETPSDEQPADDAPATITYKVSYTLGKRSNWSRVDASSEEEAETIVTDFIKNKYPGRELEVVAVEEFDEVSESVNTHTPMNEAIEGQGKYSDKCYKFLEFLQDLDNYDDIIYLTRQLIRYSQEDDLKDMWFQRFDDIASRLGFGKNDESDSIDEGLDVQGNAIESESAIGMSTVIADLIKGEYDTINEYNSAIATAEAEGYGELTQILVDIQAEENVHIGQLQALMERFNPNAELIQDGKEEGEHQLGAPSPTTDIEDTFNENLNNKKGREFIRLNKISNKFHKVGADEFLESFKSGKIKVSVVESLTNIPNYKKAISLSDSKIDCGDGYITTHNLISPYNGLIYSYTDCRY